MNALLRKHGKALGGDGGPAAEERIEREREAGEGKKKAASVPPLGQGKGGPPCERAEAERRGGEGRDVMSRSPFFSFSLLLFHLLICPGRWAATGLGLGVKGERKGEVERGRGISRHTLVCPALSHIL